MVSAAYAGVFAVIVASAKMGKIMDFLEIFTCILRVVEVSKPDISFSGGKLVLVD